MSVTTTGAGGSISFSPTVLPGHLATVTGQTLTGGGGDAVAAWLDTTGASAYSQGTVANQGVVLVSGAKRALRLDGVNDTYTVAPTLTSGAQTIAVCCSVRSVSSRVLSNSGVNSLVQPRRTVGSDQAFFNIITITPAPVTDGSPHTVVCTKAAAGTWTVYLDGVALVPSASSVVDWAGVQICGSEPCDADVWAISLLNAQLTAPQVAGMHNFLRGFAP